MTWAGVWVGLKVRDPDGADGIVMSIIFPAMFLSGIFVPVAGLPDGLRQIAELQPADRAGHRAAPALRLARPARCRTSSRSSTR